MTRYVFGFLLAVGLIVVMIFLIIRGLTAGPSAPKPLDLNSYAIGDTAVRLTIDGPVSASTSHKDIVITVSNTAATLRVTQGYEGELVRTQSYPMNVSAYGVFLHALALNGFTKGNSDSKQADERGECALGDRYIYEVLDGTDHNLQRYWYSSCGKGTFKGNASTIKRLFVEQIPDYDTLTDDVRL